MNFLTALKQAEQGMRIRRKGWSRDPHDDSFRFDLVVTDDRRVMANNRNAYHAPQLTLSDYRARDWEWIPYER